MQILNKLVRVRIAPSPTGPLHIGTARTALFNWLFARKYGGRFVLRIEDTDLERSDPKYERDITENLRWLDITWDEGIEAGGEYAPYRQSERRETYQAYIQKLLKEKKAFYCFHSQEELEREKREQFQQKEAPRHVCVHYQQPLDKNPGEGIIRFRPQEKIVKFNDLIRGEIEFDTRLFGDVSIARNVLTPLYNLAVVIDDFEMRISHVIRGEDHISNTPKQILIQELLGFPRPEYAHLPLILGQDRSKLSKRHGALSVSWYRKEGYLPEAMLNFMALLGWNPGDERELFGKEELIKEFSLERVQKGGAVFNTEKLDWINGSYIREMGIDDLTEKCIPFLIERKLILPLWEEIQLIGPEGVTAAKPIAERYKCLKSKKIFEKSEIKQITVLEQERMKKLSEIGELADFFFKDVLEYDKGLLRWKDMSDEEISEILGNLENILSKIDTKDFTKENLQKVLKAEAKRAGDIGKVFWPFRVASTGKKASPDPIDIAEVLGREKVLKRIKEAKRMIA